MLYTTLELLKKQSACLEGMKTLIDSLAPNYPKDKQISLAHIFKSNGFDHAMWALRATTVDARKFTAHMAIDFAFRVIDNFEKQFPDDKRPRTALEQTEAFLDGKITLKELESAAWSAESAARSAESAAWSAARSAESAARSAAWSAAWSAARSAAWSAASAARSAAWSAAESENEKIFKKWISKKL